MMNFKKFIEEIYPGSLTSIQDPVFGSGKSPIFPTPALDDMTNHISGVVVDIYYEKDQEAAGKQDDLSKIIIKVKTPQKIYKIENNKGTIPVIGQKITIVLNRFGEFENYY